MTKAMKYEPLASRIKRIDKLEAENERLREIAAKVMERPEQARMIMEREHIVIDNFDDDMEKFAFTMYSWLCELGYLFQVELGDSDDTN